MMPAPRHAPLGEGPFHTTHEGFTGVDRFDWDALGVGVEDARARELGRRSFILRALDEQRSLHAFTELLGQLCEAGAPIDVIGTLTRVVRDEALHVDLCDRVVERLGGWDPKAPQPRWVRSDPRQPLNRRILMTVLGSLCVGETVSVHMIKAVRENASDRVAHDVLTQILKDESFHSRFGWWWLEATPLDDADRAWAQRYLARLLPSLAAELTPKPAKKPFVANPFGNACAAARTEAFADALYRTILPGFDSAGLEASTIWNDVRAAA